MPVRQKPLEKSNYSDNLRAALSNTLGAHQTSDWCEKHYSQKFKQMSLGNFQLQKIFVSTFFSNELLEWHPEQSVQHCHLNDIIS